MENVYVYKNATIIIVRQNEDDSRIRRATETFFKSIEKERVQNGYYDKSKTINKK